MDVSTPIFKCKRSMMICQKNFSRVVVSISLCPRFTHARAFFTTFSPCGGYKDPEARNGGERSLSVEVSVRFSLPLNQNELGKLARFDVRIYGVAQQRRVRGWAEHATCYRFHVRNPLTSRALLARLFRGFSGRRRAGLSLQG